jgi:hypothetical protein
MGLLLDGTKEFAGGNKNFLELKVKGYKNAGSTKKQELDKEL